MYTYTFKATAIMRTLSLLVSILLSPKTLNPKPQTLLLPPERILSRYAFAALRSDGRVVVWGSARHGGDASAVQEDLVDVKESRLLYIIW